MRGSRASRHGRGRDVRDRHVRDRHVRNRHVRDRHVRDRHVPLMRGGRLRARFGKMRVSGARSRRRVASFWYPTRS
ncbi:hypothetical protein AQ731_17105 [Burkholderia pseudomallei]|uniref:Uncharacterized protein n=1 Tax=Burkholderia pseudomallei (strain K96243) TaxID=272560 RepID=Q63SZ8_BURPS|nr:hypothetical protein ACT79_25390 [Burkholderia pseudomallei]CAH36175.1 hypothetical protein BPSL2173 [Burkholderia pseudomallei K96243]ARK87045.1 hypothetical protein BOC42_06355 [Burkholderia pseudomallei]ARL10093.1 hypothetical protein BOC45_15890 [Burkholderia pseudomallei]ARL37064.1 hypothetical protein BOC49_13035 [Burkholderia pseudomallei]